MYHKLCFPVNLNKLNSFNLIYPFEKNDKMKIKLLDAFFSFKALFAL